MRSCSRRSSIVARSWRDTIRQRRDPQVVIVRCRLGAFRSSCRYVCSSDRASSNVPSSHGHVLPAGTVHKRRSRICDHDHTVTGSQCDDSHVLDVRRRYGWWLAGRSGASEGSIACRAMSHSLPSTTARRHDRDATPRAAHGRRRRSAAQGQQELGLRAHPFARHAALGATAPHQDRQVRALRSAARARSSSNALERARDSARARRYNGARATARRANERKGMSLEWLDRNDSTEADVCSNEERGGRFAGGRSKSLPTARGRRCCGTKRWARSRGSRRQTPSLRRSRPQATARRRRDLASRSERSPANGTRRCCRCTSTQPRSIVASC